MKTIETAFLFPMLDEKLLELLQSLSPADWEKQTIAREWRVKDVAAHLLDGNIRTISMLQDRYFGDPLQLENDSNQALVAGLNQLNADWVKAMKRVSPALLVALLRQTGPSFCKIMAGLPPHEDAIFGVAWAGQEKSANWLHVAREYTEKWIHQMQIRRALNQEGPLMEPLFYQPLINTLLMGLPHALRSVDRPIGSQLLLTIETHPAMVWYWQRNPSGWQAADNPEPDNIWASVSILPEWAWVLFSKSVRASAIPYAIQISGDEELAIALLNMVSVMA